jgi:hypothetical protein
LAPAPSIFRASPSELVVMGRHSDTNSSW